MPLPANIIIHKADDDSDDVSGLECLGCDEVGFDAMKLLSGAGGIMSGFGGMFGGDSGGGAAKPDAATQARLHAAEQSAQTMKMILIGVAAVAGAGVVVLLARK